MARWIETDSLSNQNISAPLAIGAYTATGDQFIYAQFLADQVAGNGDYIAYITLQVAGAGSAHIMGPKTTITAASGETAIGGQTGAVEVRSGDVLTVYLDGLAGDTTTPDTTVRWFELDAAPTAAAVATAVWANATRTLSSYGTLVADVWAYVTRTLTSTAAQTTATVTGSTLVIHRGDTWTAAITGLPANTDYVSIDLTIKRDLSDDDDSAIVRIRKNASGTGDGLLRLNGAALVSPAVATDGSVTVVSATALTFTLAARASDDLEPGDGLQYDIQYIKASGVTTATSGIVNITGDVTRAVV